MHIVFLVTARCNAACQHCSTSCGPDRTENLPRAKLLSLMDEAAALAGKESTELHFSISGGEPFLDFELLVDAVTHGHQLGAGMSCVTNAYWAGSDVRATALLTRLQRAGLDILAVSTSRFHVEFVPRSRVDRAVRIGHELGLTCHLKEVRGASEARDEADAAVTARTGGAHIVQFIPLFPYVRKGVRLDQADFPRTAMFPDEPCPSPVLSIHEGGDAYGCCTPGAFNAFFRLGNVHALPLAELQRRFRLGGKQQILHTRGPGYFVDEIRRRGLGDRLRPAYSGVCELCTHIAEDAVLAEVAEACAAELEMQQLAEILERVSAESAGQSLERLLSHTQGASS